MSLYYELRRASTLDEAEDRDVNEIVSRYVTGYRAIVDKKDGTSRHLSFGRCAADRLEDGVVFGGAGIVVAIDEEVLGRYPALVRRTNGDSPLRYRRRVVGERGRSPDPMG